jgi:hypothetical protein
MDAFLRDNCYQPIAQLAFSAIYVAQDWRELIARSSAYSMDAIQSGILPD